MPSDVTDAPDRSRYEIHVDGELMGFADYHRSEGAVELPHTVVDPAARGQGLASQLVIHALDEARDQHRAVIPTCSYVRRFIDDHEEYQDLLPGPSR